MALAIQFLSACIRKGIEEKIRELGMEPVLGDVAPS
jgi:hypothetical protein